ncbi:MAG: aldehyde dehydrogenase family protein, partial [Chitinophagaceae bacterium]|nr:aldehyde dehydrogenase family protein [Chitinophagaceae bacterium]
MLQIFAPYNRRLIREIPLATREEAEILLQRASSLFNDQSRWLATVERITILKKTAAIMMAQAEALANMAAEEGGKPYIDSKAEVLRAINGVEIAIGQISQLKGEQIPMGLNKASENRIAFTTREPIGVVFSICAFNHPLNLVIHQTVTAIAAGCPVIIKPAATTPLSCLNFIGILKEAGLPEGWCESIVCSNEMAEAIAIDPRIGYLSFIGSAKVGWHLRSRLAPGTRCALEHGGAAPVIVEKDADVAELVPALLKGGFYHAGQVCVSVQRIFINADICGQVSRLLSEGAQKLIVGDPLDKNTEVGPLILPKEVDRVHAWITEAVQQGAKLLCGGKKISDTCYEPTVLLDPPGDARISTLEVFGPVVCIYSYSDREEAIKKANSLDLHFQASVFTKNIDVAMECVKKLNATAVMVNDHTAFRVDWMPFGGRDSSGLGMGGIPYTMHEMPREKLVVIKSK